MITDYELCQDAAYAYTTQALIVVDGDVHVVVTHSDGVATIAFRGTVPTSLEDWERDVSVWPHSVPDHPKVGLCHTGFATGAEAAVTALLPDMASMGPFALTGHSLGGAMAIIATGLLVDAGFTPIRLSTFGAPRVSLDDKLGNLIAGVGGKRFRNGQDPVPTAPFWPYITDRIWSNVGVIRHSGSVIEDHFVANYLKALTP